MEIKNLKITEIKPYENNPRINDDAVIFVANSIQEFGFKVPIVIDKNNVIVTGHTRYKAAVTLGLEEIPVVIADDLTEDQIKAFRLADNKAGEIATWDFEKLEEEHETLGMDMSAFGFEFLDDTINTESNFNYKEQYAVIVMCDDKQHQQDTYEHLTDEGYDCKMIAV